MKQPIRGQLFQKQEYWRQIDREYSPGALPDWAFDFISVHQNTTGDFSLLSCLSLVPEAASPERVLCGRRDYGRRPVFERFGFASKKEATQAARDIARGRREVRVFVVDCC